MVKDERGLLYMETRMFQKVVHGNCVESLE